MMINFKTETLAILEDNGKTINDVVWAGNWEFEIPLDLFWNLADFVYDDGYGAENVAKDLLLVGKDFWLERNTYDGSEWWEYKSFPSRPQATREVDRIHYEAEYSFDWIMWDVTLPYLNGPIK